MPFLTLLKILAGAAVVGGSVASAQASKKATRLQERQQELNVQRSRRQSIRDAQVTRARAIASSEALGSQGSSGQLGGINNISSQLGERFGFSTQMSGLSRQITQQLGRAQTYSSIASIGGTGFNIASQLEK